MARSPWNLRSGAPLRDVATLVDVGVNRGTPGLYEAFPHPYYLLIEPVEERIPYLEKIIAEHPGEYIIAAAGAEVGSAMINVETSRIGLSSFLERTTPFEGGCEIEKREVPVTTIDEVCRQRQIADPIGIKIDTEGFELPVIQGAQETLRRTAWVIAEVSVAERFEGGYRAHEMIAEMRCQGFAVADVLRSTRGYVDVVFTPIQPTEHHRPRRSLTRMSTLEQTRRICSRWVDAVRRTARRARRAVSGSGTTR